MLSNVAVANVVNRWVYKGHGDTRAMKKFMMEIK